jgi:hypothetical protein
MKLSGFLSAFGRRAWVAVGLAVVVSAVSVVGAYGPAVASVASLPVVQDQPDPMTFNADRLFVYFQVAPEVSRDFELVMNKIKTALAGSDDPERRRQASGWDVVKLDAPQADGNIMYIFILDPVAKGVSYDPFKILGDALPAGEVRELYDTVGPGVKGISTAPFSNLISMGGMD